jgi:MFS family permease
MARQPELAPGPGSDETPAARRVPWWAAPFFGRQARLDPAALRLLGLVSLGMLFENYDIGLLNAALLQIARDLDISAGATGYYLATIRLGGLGTFLLVPFADRIGRRRIFLLSLVGMSVGTLATAASQTAVQFALLQMVTRVFMLTGTAVALVMLVEEFPAERRGAAIGMMSVLGGLGYGLGAGLYAAVDLLPFGWRSLYAFGITPLLVLPTFRRTLRETARFEEHRRMQLTAARGGLREWLRPMVELARVHPRRAASVGLAGTFGAMSAIVVFQYTSYFVQTAHGWKPGDYTLLVIAGGMIGVSGNLVGGRGSDRFGRRRVGPVCWLLVPLCAALFYNGPAAALVVAWGLCVFFISAGDLVVRALSAELFPTSHRGTASGWLIAVQTLGWSVGLFLVGLGTASPADLGPAVTAVAFAGVLAAVSLLLLPETGRRELESIAADLPAGES